MRQTIITLCLLLTAVCGWAQKVWNNPYSFCEQKRFKLVPQEVEFKQDETIIHMSVSHSPGTMICFPNFTVLKDQDGKKYALKSAVPTRSNEDSCYVGQWVNIPESGVGVYSLHFEPLPETTERIHFIESYDDNGFLVWNIQEAKSQKMSGLFNSNWRNEQGDWVLGLYDSGAVYGGKIYTYSEKSDKKVVLTNGTENLTIAIGKEKAGKRQFTVNGQKTTLESFGTTLPAYPTEDNTAFNTELSRGEAVITGWIKDFPKEITDKQVGISVKVTDTFTGQGTDIRDVSFDDAGQFTIKVKLNGAQSVIFQEVANNVNVFETRLVLEPGSKCFLMHDWANATCLLMGDNARLQNELLSFPCTYEHLHVGDHNIKIKRYENEMARLNSYLANNPTLSKRYRDFINEDIRYTAASNIFRSRDEIEGSKAADKIANINTAMPLSLTPAFLEFLNYKVRITYSKISDKYSESPALFESFEKQGKIKFSESDHEFMKKWQQKIDISNKIRDCKTQQEAMAMYDEMEKFLSYKEIKAFIEREDISKVYNEWKPNSAVLYNNVVDSLLTDQQIRDFYFTSNLCSELSYSKQLSKGSMDRYNLIKNNNFKQVIDDLMNFYSEQAKKNEELVKKVIAPASNVEGLTDGKVIIEKMIEPYKGKIVYMDVWGTWCQPCINAIKSSPKIKEAVKDYDIVYLYFAIHSEDAAWKGAIAEYGLTKPNYVHYNLPVKQQDAVTEYLQVDGVPFYVLFDKNGNMEKLDRGHIGDTYGFKKKIEELSKR